MAVFFAVIRKPTTASKHLMLQFGISCIKYIYSIMIATMKNKWQSVSGIIVLIFVIIPALIFQYLKKIIKPEREREY